MKTLSTFFAFMLPVSLAWAVDVTPSASSTTQVASGNTYFLNAKYANAVTEFTLSSTATTDKLASNLVINTQIGDDETTHGDIKVNLDKVYLSHETPIVVNGTGTVTLNATNWTRFEHTSQVNGIILNAPDADVRLQSASHTSIRFICAYDTKVVYKDVDVLPIKAKSVTIESGTVYCWALATGTATHGGAGYPLTPCIITDTLTLASEDSKLYPSFFPGSAFNSSTVASQRLPVKYTTLNCTTGVISNDANTLLPGLLILNRRYNYPTASQENLIADAKGGTVFGVKTEPEDPAENTKTFTFPDWTDFTGNKADYLSCFKSSTTGNAPTADAITIDAENKSIIIDTTLCPDPELVYAADAATDAVTLFGATAIPTAEGMQVSYNFGISWIGLVGGTIQGTIQMEVAVELPYETADTKEFHITVTREDGLAIPDIPDNLTFTRVPGTNLFRSTRINTGENPYGKNFTFHTYRVSASEAVTE